jgi:putative drug exporter of the RND superfamily
VLWCAAALTLGATIFGLPATHLLRSDSEQFQDPASGYERADAAIRHATGRSPYFGVNVLLVSHSPIPGNQRAVGATGYIASLLAHQRGFQAEADLAAAHAHDLLSRSGRETIVLAAFASPAESVVAADRLRALLRARRAASRLDGMRAIVGGPDITFDELDRRTISDLRQVELLAVPMLLAISFWVFGGMIAGLLPLLVGGSAILLGFLALRLVDQVTGMSVFALNVVSGLGLGLGIDYSLLMVRRFREELARDHDPGRAIAGVMRSAGRTVLLSALTVATAMLALLAFPLEFLRSMAVGGAITALLAGAISVTVLPAALVSLGERVDALAPLRMGARGTLPGSGAWKRIALGVMRRPALVATLTGGALLLLAAPALHLRLSAPSATLLPAAAPSRVVEARLAADFAPNPAATIPVILPAHSTAGRDARSRAALYRQISALAGTRARVSAPAELGAGTWQIALAIPGSPYTSANQRLVRAIAEITRGSGALTGGLTAYFVDQRDAIASHIPLALALLAAVTCGFLFWLTGSLVLPLKALAMNVLTASAGAGLLVAIFQQGRFASVLGFTPIGGLEEANLLFLLVIAFALSTDYEVFLMARIKEAREGGLANVEAIAAGVQQSGGLITAAALLFCIAVGAFVTSGLFFVKQFGLGAALTVAIDASVIRILLVPALMALLGDWNWWAPTPLKRLRDRFGSPEAAYGMEVAADAAGGESR